jgi:hypothetical protein
VKPEAVAEENPFNLEDLIVKPDAVSAGAKASSKVGSKATRQRAEPFIQITASQAAKLVGAASVVTIDVFFHLMFRSFKSYHKSFLIKADALAYAGINRRAQLRALEDLVELGLIRVRRESPRKPPEIIIVGLTKQG